MPVRSTRHRTTKRATWTFFRRNHSKPAPRRKAKCVRMAIEASPTAKSAVRNWYASTIYSSVDVWLARVDVSTEKNHIRA